MSPVEVWNSHPMWFQVLAVLGLVETVYIWLRYGMPHISFGNS